MEKNGALVRAPQVKLWNDGAARVEQSICPTLWSGAKMSSDTIQREKGRKGQKDRFVLAAAWARNPPEQLLPPARRQQSGI